MDFEKIVEIAELAGEAILEVYNKSGDIKIEHKGDDSPLTEADLAAHNIIVEGRADLSRESLMFSPGESQDILFADAGDYNFFCGPHQGAGMTGIIHVN